MKSQNQPGLDYDFLRYIGVERETQRKIQRFYLPFFEGCKRVVDLACGDGDFVELLKGKGIEATGVDWDEKCCAAARERGLKVVCQDVFEYLEGLEAGTVDGVFCSHLVEHLPYERVIELLRLAHRALEEGGRIVLSTPNVRGLFSHLEMFYLHFGHVTFYHPRLLSFLLEHVGFSSPEMGENPALASPLWGTSEEGWLVPPVRYDPVLPLTRKDPLHRLVWRIKMFLVRLIVQPYLDEIVGETNCRLQLVDHLLKDLDRSFECYVLAHKI